MKAYMCQILPRLIFFLLIKNIFCLLSKIEATCGSGAQSVTVKSTDCRFDPHSRQWNIYLNLYFHFFALVSDKARRWVPLLNTQCLQISAECGKRSVRTIGDTAWSWLNYFFYYRRFGVTMTKLESFRYTFFHLFCIIM